MLATRRLRPPGPGAGTLKRSRRPLLGLLVFVLYLIPAVVAFWPSLSHIATVQQQAGVGDLAKYNWSVAWVPYALAHGQNPLVTHVANIPDGVNLMDDTSVLGLGLIMAPVTVLFGSFASVNVLLILAFPLSAGAGYLLARRYTSWRPAAFAAGLLYGYSPYMVAQGSGHLNLSFVPIPPLVFLILDELVVRQRREPVRQGLLLGALMSVQFMISTEIFATTVLFGAISLVVVAIWFRDEVRARLSHALRGLASGAILAAVLLAWPAFEAILGPHHLKGAIGGFPVYTSALLGPLLPTSVLELGTHHMKAIADKIGRNASENGSYLGLPLIVAFTATVFWVRRRPVRIAAVMAVIAFVLSLGVRLHIGVARYAETTRDLVLPGAVLDKIPFIDDSFPVRYTLYVALYVSLVLAMGLEALRFSRRRGWLAGLVAVVVFLPLLPDWPYPGQGRIVIPPYFTTSAVRALAPGEVTLVYPMAGPTDSAAMDWQTVTDMRFSMAGGYFVLPRPSGGSQFEAPTQTALTLGTLSGGQAVARTPGLRTVLRAELAGWGVRAVVAQPTGADPVGFFTWLIGRPPDARTGGMVEWYHTAWEASR